MSLNKMKRAQLIEMVQALQADNLELRERIEQQALSGKLQPRVGGNANQKFSAKQSTEWMLAVRQNLGLTWRDKPTRKLLGVDSLNDFTGTFEDAMALTVKQ